MQVYIGLNDGVKGLGCDTDCLVVIVDSDEEYELISEVLYPLSDCAFTDLGIFELRHAFELAVLSVGEENWDNS